MFISGPVRGLIQPASLNTHSNALPPASGVIAGTGRASAAKASDTDETEIAPHCRERRPEIPPRLRTHRPCQKRAERTPMNLKTSEIDLHRSVANFLDWMVMPPAVWTTFPAGWTAMKKGAAGRLRGCGLKAGMPDILVFYNGFTIGIELKTKTEISRPQEAMFAKLRNAGVLVHICRDIEDVYQALALCHHVPMRKFNYGQSYKAPESRRPEKSAQSASSPAP